MQRNKNRGDYIKLGTEVNIQARYTNLSSIGQWSEP